MRIQQQDRRVMQERFDQRQPLAHAGAVAFHQIVGAPCQVNELEQPRDSELYFCGRHLVQGGKVC